MAGSASSSSTGPQFSLPTKAANDESENKKKYKMLVKHLTAIGYAFL